MKKRYIDLPKGDVSLLAPEELKELSSLVNSPALILLNRISEDFVTKMTALAVESQEDEAKLRYLDAAYYMKNSLALLLDAPQRAKEELKGTEVLTPILKTPTIE